MQALRPVPAAATRADPERGEAQRHQVTELPPIQPYVIEYQCLKVVCPACGEGTRAPLPEEAQGNFGPQLMALIAYLTIYCRMPRRVVEAFLEQVLGISMSLGSTKSVGSKPAPQ